MVSVEKPFLKNTTTMKCLFLEISEVFLITNRFSKHFCGKNFIRSAFLLHRFVKMFVLF